MYDDEQVLILECKTNNYGYHTTYSVTDAEGNVILERSDLDNNTIYTDELDLAMGAIKSGLMMLPMMVYTGGIVQHRAQVTLS